MWQSTLFNPGETVGFKAEANAHKPTANSAAQFFCINPLLSYGGGAGNANISAHRNFLIESDSMGLPAQRRLLELRMQLPFALKTFSAGKSYHYIVALTDDVGPDKYKDYWQYLKYLLNGRIDPSCSNPSRLSRTPGALRSSNGMKQRLMDAGERISPTTWERWLYGGPNAATWHIYNTVEVPRLAEQQARARSEAGSGELADWLKGFNAALVSEGKRHHVLTAMACSLVSTGYAGREEFIVRAAESMGKTGEEALKVLYWAERKLSLTL